MQSTNSPKVFYSALKGKVKIINDDFLTTNHVKEKSTDLVITSPPYNVDIKYGDFQDDMTYDDYLEFTSKWLQKTFNVLKDDGRFCLNVPLDKNKGGQQSVYADFVRIAKDIGFKYHSTVIWNEGNISRRTAWGSWKSASAPYVIAPVEVVVILYKDSWKKFEKGESDITRDEFIEWTNGLWTFNGEKKSRVGHPAPFPVELPRRCMKLFSYLGDVVLDPFSGSGTTLVACALNGRKGIGVDVDLNYCEIAKQRLIDEAGVLQTRLM
ncbi:MAG: DNA-methyltransferase [Candidatus Hodarchaeota archaeon]